MRLIDVDALIETMRENAEGNEGWYGDTWAFMRDVENAPTIDAVPVVRCKDCVYYQDNNNGYPHNECRWRSDETPDATDFCSYGERKDDGIDS